ncbi:uncharacterized protein BDZ99DRAFT_276448 [Mytilinidion resinicola]|uniref:Protein kinase domain-containing protein n=1 Tax=Mytilinidion resinicola TaxID=574789 RepID=A0A6A6YRV2_9PEZI|nr:uncharacterized protein BDZ99DRAFT_276448 [Mytilinidion resinicola]KAF2811501.1 hypothetical protein BDZ99DRAFT_276448 [Mytilinidion resinicola]
MLNTSTVTFRSIDRDTGTAISTEQKEDCSLHYAVIRDYIDEIQRKPLFPMRWTRTRRRRSTSELLGAVEQVSDYIRWRPYKITDGVDGIWLLSEASIEAHGSDGSGTAILTPQFYQSASNLLHELMSRLVDGEDISTDKPEAELATASPDAVGLCVPQSKIRSFEANPALSILTKSLATSGSFIATSSKISDDELQYLAAAYQSGDQNEMAKGVTFEDDPDEQAFEGAVAGEEPSNTANDWVFEYLRGGMLSQPQANPRVEEYESVASFAFTMDEIFPQTKKLPRHRHLDFNESSVHGKNSGHSLFGQSNQSERDFFKTPKSIMSGNSPFRTPHSRLGGLERAVQPGSPSAWNKYLREIGLIPDPFDEMDWSGRGQHAEFNANEESDVPLTLEKALGHSATALVESVRCRRIRLARKTVMVSRRLTKEEVIKEVENLQRLKHPHVIRVVGTYTLPRKLSILLYPVAEFTLD